MQKMTDRDYVDKEHKIDLPEMNATIYFLKHSETSGIKQAQELLINAYEKRIGSVQ
ncbi:hypothetical protein [uncultured Ruminococcus sp.]|uniref:hypothetical protein n=1 Tax=uncultured Ruminococcus sp. TaxID=165186 RepID=UPI0025F7A428|nr:hypothetical protein [uncultured Ruminococcus sp.]